MPATINIGGENEIRRAPREARGKVLVVEDDPVSRSFLKFALTKQGYKVDVAEDALDARRQLSPAGMAAFSCVVTDYRMPGSNGLELLAWIQEADATLATIIITAEGEKNLVADSLRSGAADFLDKPVGLEELNATVARAIQRTRRQRQLTQSETDVRQLGRVQEQMLGLEAGRSPTCMDVCFHPKHEAGGDFFSHFRPAEHQLFCWLTDVSGHDLQAAYISSYFQGIVRGMRERGAPMEEIFTTFNRLLLDEWNQAPVSGQRQTGIGASVATCAVMVDTMEKTATVMAQGTPAPVYWTPDGEARLMVQTSGIPLGWFADFSPRKFVQPVVEGGTFSLWTDGLEEMAGANGVTELSLACALQRARANRSALAGLEAAADDILLVDVHLSAAHSGAESFRPVILEQYHGAQSEEIDGLQAIWERSLMLAAPELSGAKLHDVLLASREMLLNALEHGCAGCAGQAAGFQIAYAPAMKSLRVRVCDPGDGHQFDIDGHEVRASEELRAEHRGLILAKHLTSRLTTARNGASLIMDFAWA